MLRNCERANESENSTACIRRSFQVESNVLLVDGEIDFSMVPFFFKVLPEVFPKWKVSWKTCAPRVEMVFRQDRSGICA